MKYVLCVIAVIAEILIFSFLLSVMGATHLSLISYVIECAILTATCRAIIKHFSGDASSGKEESHVSEENNNK